MASFGNAEAWNPMVEDYNNPHFNTYLLPTLGQDMPSDATVKLFVAGVPPCLTEQGMKNLFSKVARVQHVILKPHLKIAFIVVRRSDAMKLIAYFNNYRLGDSYLTVKPARENRRPGNQPVGTVHACDSRVTSSSGNEKQQNESTSGVACIVKDLEIPSLTYPTAAKYVQVGQELSAAVLGVHSPSQFWISNLSSVDVSAAGRLEEIGVKMREHYSSLQPKVGFRPNGSGLYAAPRKESGSWCRVQALEFDTQSVLVLFLDYGVTERLRLSELHALEGQFLALPFQAIQCRLAHIRGKWQWSEEAVGCMRQLLGSDQVRAKVCNIDGYILDIELILSSGQTVNEILVSRNFASDISGSEPETWAHPQRAVVSGTRSVAAEASEGAATDHPTVKNLNFVPLTVGQQYEVVVLHARSASDFTVCPKDNLGELQTLCADLNAYQLSDFGVPHVGEVVAAKYVADSSWYRAEILSLDVDGGGVVVRFVDFGNTSSVCVKSLVRLQPQHVAFPVYASTVKFRNPDVDGKLPSEFSNLKLRVVERQGGCYVVALGDDKTELPPVTAPPSQVASFADLKHRRLDAGKKYLAMVTEGSNLEEFYVRVSGSDFEYESLLRQLCAIYAGESGGYSPLHVGELVAVRLAVDNMWYRAAVEDLGSTEAVKCRLIDFGASWTAARKDIGRFDPRLLAVSVSVFKCSFHDAVAAQSTLDSSKHWMPADAVFEMTVVEVKDDLHFVELFDNNSRRDWKQKLIDAGLLVKAGSGDSQLSASVDKLSLKGVECGGTLHKEDHGKNGIPGDGNQESEPAGPIVKSKPLLDPLSDDEVRKLCLSREKIRIMHANSPSDFYIQSGSGLGVHCAIDRAIGSEPGGTWSRAVVEWFQNTCENGDFVLKSVIKSDLADIWLVDLLDRATGKTVRNMLATQQPPAQIANKNKSVSEVAKSKPPVVLLSSALKNASVEAGDTVAVTCIRSPSDFFVQQRHENSAEVFQQLDAHCKSGDQAYSPQKVGELIAVLHGERWHRAEVLSLGAHSASVFLVDCGNTVFDVDAKNLRVVLPPLATALPKLAVHCALGGITGVCRDGSYTEAAVMWFRDNFLHVPSTIVRVKPSDSSLLINLKNGTSDKTARKSLLDYGLALAHTSTDAVPVGAASNPTSNALTQSDVPSRASQPVVQPTTAESKDRARFANARALAVGDVVCVVHTVSPVHFFVIPADPAALDEMRKLQEYCGTSAATSYIPQYTGEPVAAKFEGDWYRAEVMWLMLGESFEVFFVDFGNTSVVGPGDLRSLPEEFAVSPKRAVRCGIDGVAGTEAGREFSEAAKAWFSEKLPCGTHVTLSSVRVDGEKCLVNMSLDGDDVKQLILAAQFARI